MSFNSKDYSNGLFLPCQIFKFVHFTYFLFVNTILVRKCKCVFKTQKTKYK